ncbi:unnamed protein product [Cochlearia groenlandica]
MNRERCVACFKEFVVHLDLVEHMLMNAHSPHQPRCGICQKHFHTLESVREHLRGLTKQCASVLLVDLEENVIFSTYIQPRFPVSDYRYTVTGLTEDNLKDGMALEDARDHVISILSGGNVLLVGHDLRPAMSFLGVKHPLPLLRYEIQCGGERKLYEDCVSAMRLYKRIWDQEHGEARSKYGLAAFDVRQICAMNPQELYDNSKLNYYCWCNDRRAAR